MKQYTVSITEVLSTLHLVDAESAAHAIEQTQEAWKNGDVVLDYNDFQGVDYEIEEIKDVFTTSGSP